MATAIFIFVAYDGDSIGHHCSETSSCFGGLPFLNETNENRDNDHENHDAHCFEISVEAGSRGQDGEENVEGMQETREENTVPSYFPSAGYYIFSIFGSLLANSFLS